MLQLLGVFRTCVQISVNGTRFYRSTCLTKKVDNFGDVQEFNAAEPRRGNLHSLKI